MLKKYHVTTELRHEWYIFLILLVVFLIGIFVYPHLPEKTAIHWNLEGKPDGYGSRFTGAFTIPLVTLGLYLLFLFLPLLDPRRDNYPQFARTYRLIKLAFVLFMLGLHLLTLAFNLGYKVEISRFVTLGLGLLFTILGKGLPQIAPNYFVGIKTPWTLSSPHVWAQTHHLGGKLFFWSGLLVISSTILPDRPRFWIMMVLLIGSTLAATVYSYLSYRREQQTKAE